MSLHIRVSNQVQTIKSGYLFYGGYSSPLIGVTTFPTAPHLYDFLLEKIRDGFICPSFSRNVAEWWGLRGYDGVDSDIHISDKPYTDKHVDWSRHDAHYYGNFYRNLELFGAVLSGKAFVVPSPTNEHFIRHDNLSGELIAGQTDIPTYVDDYEFFGTTVPIHNPHGNIYIDLTVNTVLPLSVTISPGYQGGFLPNLVDLLRFLEDGYEVTDLAHGYSYSRRLSAMRYSISSAGIDIRYHMYARSNVSGAVYEWDSRIEVPFLAPPSVGIPIEGMSYHNPSASTVTFSYSNALVDGDTTDIGPLSDSYSTQLAYPVALSQPPPLDTDGIWRVETHYVPKLKSLLFDYSSRFADAYYDITPSSMFSTVDAFKAAEGYLGTNILQNLQKLPGIASALPHLREAVSVMSRVLHRDLSVSTLKEILDLATSTHLQASFEWRPYIGVVTTYVPQMISTLHSVGLPSKNAIGYGSFRYKLSNELGREEVTLLTRTKIVMTTSPSGLLAAVTGADALGVLPKASNLWDLLPFTFVVNWFTGVGESLRRAEYSLLLATIPAYFVHTYIASSPLSVKELDSLKMSSSSTEPASLRMFYRDVSLYSPFPRDSRFGFGIPKDMPFMGVLGSLLYQLIFG